MFERLGRLSKSMPSHVSRKVFVPHEKIKKACLCRSGMLNNLNKGHPTGPKTTELRPLINTCHHQGLPKIGQTLTIDEEPVPMQVSELSNLGLRTT